MAEKKELNDEELESVNGGCGECAGLEDPGFNGFSGYVNMYSLIEGNEYWFVSERGKRYFRGRVERTWEKDNGIGTIRKHKIRITDDGSTSFYLDQSVELTGDSYAVYTRRG